MIRRLIKIDWTGFGKTKHWLSGWALFSYVMNEEMAKVSQLISRELYAVPPILTHLDRPDRPNLELQHATIKVSGEVIREVRGR